MLHSYTTSHVVSYMPFFMMKFVRQSFFSSKTTVCHVQHQNLIIIQEGRYVRNCCVYEKVQIPYKSYMGSYLAANT